MDQPCPFCRRAGAELVELVDQPGDEAVAMQCPHCGGRGPEALDDAEALRLWNEGAAR